MANDSMTLNPPSVARRWSRPYAITLSDTNTDRNLQYNTKFPYRFIQNNGTAGKVTITFEPDNATSTAVAIYLAQGQVLEGGHWVHARSTGTDAGVSLIGFVGCENVGS